MFALSLTGLQLVLAVSHATAQAASYSNPIKGSNAGDPNIVYQDGYYYLMTTGNGASLTMQRAPTLEGLKTGETRTVWTDTTPQRCCNLWAPEMHVVDGSYVC